MSRCIYLTWNMQVMMQSRTAWSLFSLSGLLKGCEICKSWHIFTFCKVVLDEAYFLLHGFFNFLLFNQEFKYDVHMRKVNLHFSFHRIRFPSRYRASIRLYRSNEFHPKFNLPVATKMVQMQNPLLKFPETKKGNFTGEDLLITTPGRSSTYIHTHTYVPV